MLLWGVLLFVVLLPGFGMNWGMKTWVNLTMEEMIDTLTSPLEGTGGSADPCGTGCVGELSGDLELYTNNFCEYLTVLSGKEYAVFLAVKDEAATGLNALGRQKLKALGDGVSYEVRSEEFNSNDSWCFIKLEGVEYAVNSRVI